jgi:PleD family two-component response regulator
MKILVLETNEKGKKVTERLLKEKYYNLAIMFHPDHIFTALKNEVFHVIFIPLEMKGLDSLELCRKIKILYPKVILHAYSDQCEFFNPETMERIGFDGLMNRPLRKKTSFNSVEKAFGDWLGAGVRTSTS